MIRYAEANQSGADCFISSRLYISFLIIIYLCLKQIATCQFHLDLKNRNQIEKQTNNDIIFTVV